MVLEVTKIVLPLRDAFKEERGGRVIGREEVGNLWYAGYALLFYLTGNNCENSSRCILMTFLLDFN